ncbi:cytidine deaminase [Bacillus sp. C1-1]|nr:cytidine deaminase [Bacillus sp. C1-1]
MIKPKKLNKYDYELIKEAEKVIKKYYNYERHHIGVAVRTKSCNIYSAVHLEANVGRITVCGEAIAIGKSISEGEKEIVTIVAVAHPHPFENTTDCWVVTPCGMCRELISDYGSGIDVIIPFKEKIIKCNIMDLLPEKYK